MRFAARPHVDRSPDGAAEFVRTNVPGTRSALQAALRTGTVRSARCSNDYGWCRRTEKPIPRFATGLLEGSPVSGPRSTAKPCRRSR
ncbi:hypothetical protein ACTWJ9_04410 [Streptomyces sp. GDS52]|uniref:hypothetical protein n=1 Tax=Streptomyces TaxID=1883 RepID=UPI00311AE8F2